MRAIRVQTVVQEDGELHLSNLPFRKGEQVEAVVQASEADGASARQAARERFLRRARVARFRSTGRYPTRDELHERP